MSEISTIRIDNLKLRAIIGLNDWERNVKQDILVNIVLRADISEAVATDDISGTVDYKNVKNLITAEVESSHYQLIESLAHRILAITTSQPGVIGATVRVDKPGALSGADSVSVEVSSKDLT